MAKELRILAGIFMTVVIGGLLMSTNASAASDYPVDEYPFHQNPDELVVTRSDHVVNTLPCERIALDVEGRTTPHIGASVGRTSDGTLYAAISGGPTALFASTDDGRTWTRSDVDVPEDGGIGVFTVLADDSFLGVAGGAAKPISFYRSADRGQSWEKISELPLEPFEGMYPDGNLLQLRDGTILFPVNWRVNAPEGGNVLGQGLFVQYVTRSTDGGRTWQNGPDPAFWRRLIEAKLTVVGVSKEAQNPGPGGSFPGCFETGIEELPDGTILAALRYSGAPEPWHSPEIVAAWRGGEPDIWGRMFKNVLLSDSPDGGHTWQNLRPVVDAEGQTLLPHYDTSAVLVQVPDGRLVMAIVRRRADPQQLVAKVSEDGGQTWLPEEYRLAAGFGYPDTLALKDGTIITVTGKSREGGPLGAEVIRWRLPER